MQSNASIPSLQLPAKLVRPRLNNVYYRTRLFEHLQANGTGQAVWVHGPAGSGKTSVVNSFLHSRELPCIWYELDESDSDIASFFYHLRLAALLQCTEQTHPPPLLTAEFLQTIPMFTRRFFSLMCNGLKPPLVFVLDNYQEVKKESLLHEVLCTAIDSLGQDFSVIVCSRERPPAELARPQANCSLNLVGWKQLKLQREEAKGIISLAAETDADIPDDVICDLHRKTDGWVAGLLLLLRRGVYEEIAPHMLSRHTAQEVFDYFSTVIFQRLEPEVQEILLRLGFLPRISKNIAEKVTGGKAMDLLENMFSRNTFTYRAIEEEPVYYFHPLFSEFLQAQCAKQLDDEELKALQATTAKALETEGWYEEALQLYMRCDHIQEAIGLILSQAPSLMAVGRFQTLLQWIDHLPTTVTEAMPWLLFWRGVAEITSNPLKGQPYLRRALTEFGKMEDPEGCYLALSGMIDSILFQTNDFSELDPYIDAYYFFEEKYGRIDAPQIWCKIAASMLNAISQRRPDSPDMPLWIERGWKILQNTKDVNVALQVFIPIMNLRLMEGELAEAGHLLEIFRRVKPKETSPLAYLIYLTMRSLHSWFSGDFVRGLQAAEEGMNFEKKTGIQVAYMALRSHGAASALGMGELKRAQQLMEEVTPVMVQGGYWLQVLYHCIFSWLLLCKGDISQAVFHAEAALDKGKKCGHPLVYSSIYVLVSIIHIESNNTAKAKKYLQQALKYCKQYRTFQNEFLCLLTKARLALNENDPHFSGYVEQAFRHGRIRDYKYIFFWQSKVMARLCAEALKQDIEVDYVCSLIEKHELLPETPPLSITSWPWPVRLYSFGGFRLEQKGKVVTFARKAQQRSLSLLRYLLAHGGETVADLHIQNALWPDADGDAAKNAYNTALHRLRKLLGNDRALIHSDGRLSFNLFLVWTDIQYFLRCLREIKAQCQEPGAISMEVAVVLLDRLTTIYRGRFLPNEDAAWAIPMRERLHSRFFAALQELGSIFEQAENPEAALQCYLRGVDVDPSREVLYEKQMKILVRLGKRTEALDLYDRCRAVLESQGDLPSRNLELLREHFLHR